VVIAAADYPLLDVFWTILIFFVWVAWIWTVVTVLADVFRRRDLSGWGKAAWIIFVIAVPFLGVLAYLIGHSDDMAERNVKEAQASRAQFDDYVRTVGASDGPAAEIEKGKGLLDSGSITAEEFESIKAKALA
jgi:hypothetical protein